MPVLQDEIRINYTDRDVNSMLSKYANSQMDATRHYNQSGDFFLKLNEEFFVPSFPIHHDVRMPSPTEQYLETLKIYLAGVVPLVPQVFSSLTYFFNPTDILRPSFFQLYRLAGVNYLYILKVDLAFKTHEHTLIQRGTNSATAEYRSKKIFLEGLVIPLNGVQKVDDRISSFQVKQTIDQTWIGETGRGYMVQGIWIDHELTKFFSKIFLPPRTKTFPHYPFQCKYRTICQEVIDLDLESRKRMTPHLHRAVTFIEPMMDKIQDALHSEDFSEDLPIFK
ncbi:MAG: hypothetical protein HN368_03550, partial [Spirochaetales bacterium]|nr:hypothetical protein [Spirochaetales bacterium]